MRHRWVVVGLLLVAAFALTVSGLGGRWWSLAGIEIGPFGSRQCFDGEDCKRIGLSWLGGSERWMRTGVATWAACLIAGLVLVITAGGVAARRVPRLAAMTALVAVGTAAVAGILFVVQYPGLDGGGPARGLWLFIAGVIVALVPTILIIRTRRPS